MYSAIDSASLSSSYLCHYRKLFPTAHIITVLCLTTLALATKPLKGADPNALSCDPEGQEFLLLPSYDDCSKFYMCTHGQEVEFTCPAGTIFDFELQGCNFEWATTCILRKVPGSSWGVEGSGDSSVEWTPEGSGGEGKKDVKNHVEAASAKLNEYFSQTMLNCRTTEDATRQIAYRGDCQRYWRCVSGVPHAVYCSDGLFFNENSQQCDFEANVRCLVATDDDLNGEFITA